MIDTNVVKMVFDNQGFEQGVGTTISTLDKLKSALRLDGAVQGLQNISDSAKSITFDAMNNSLANIQSGFNALDVVAIRVLQNITDMAMNAGRKLLESITVEPLKAGLQEYETQINAVQTILANTNDALAEQGLTTEHDRIEKINGVLDDLNKYADMTIYNFTEMTRNIGTFTAAGVELDTAATSIKGIANLAAMSGSNSQQASTAMYQLSQAIAAGSVKLQDWNSVVNAGMGGKLFQNELIDTAKAMGVADEQFIALTQGATTFRESLSSGWISAEVLTNTLEKFTAGSEGYTKSQVQQMQQLWRARGYSEQQIQELTGSIKQLDETQEQNLRTKWAEKGFSDEQIDHILSMGTAATEAATKVKTFTQLLETVGEALQSGWTQSWEYIVGDFEQAKMLWTEISDIMNLYIGKSADARNAVLEQWSKAAYSYNEAGQLIRVADGQIVEGGKMVAEEMGGREAVIQSLRNTFQGLLEIGVQFRKAWDWYFKGLDDGDKKNPLTDITISGEKLIAMSKKLLKFTEDFKESLKFDDQGNAIGILGELRKSFDLFAQTMRNAYFAIKDIFSGLGNIFASFFKSSFFSVDSLNSIVAAISIVVERVQEFGEAFNKHFGKTDANRDGLTKFFSGLQGILESTAWAKIDFISNAFRAFGQIIEYIIGPGTTISTILGDVGNKMSEFAHALDNLLNDEEVSKFKGMFDSIVEGLKPFIDSIKDILSITTNGSVTGLQAFFNQLISIMNGKYANIDLFNMFQKVLESILNIIKAIISVATPIFQAFVNVFGPSLAAVVSYLRDIIDRVHSFTDSLVLNKEAMEGVYKLFEGIFSVLRGIGEILVGGFIAAWDSLANIFSQILPSSNDLGKNLGSIGDKLKSFGDTLSKIASGEADIPSLADGIGLLGDKIAGFIKAVKGSEVLKDLGEIFGEIFERIKTGLFGSEGEASVLSKIGESIKEFIKNVKEALLGEDGLDAGDIVAGGGVLFAIKKIIDFIKDAFGGENKGLFDTIKDTISDVGEALCDTFESIQNRLKFDALEKIAKSILMIAGSLFVISLIDAESLVRSLVAIGILMESMELLMESITKLEGVGTKDIAAAAAAMISLGVALFLVAAACKILSKAEPEELARGLIATVILIGTLTEVTKELTKNEGKIIKGAGGLIALAVAVDLLCIAVKALGGMSWDELAKGLLATIGLIFALTEAASRIGKDFSFGDGAGLLLLAFGIKTLASAVKELGGMSWEDLAKGLLGFAVSLGLVVAALRILDEYSVGSELIKDAAAILILSVAMIALSESIKIMGSLNWDELARGLIGFGVALAAITGASIAISKFGDAGSTLALAALAASMILLAEALKIVGSMDLMSQIIPGLIGLAGAIGVLVIAAYALEGAAVGVGLLLALAGSIALIGAGMLAFGAGLAALGAAVATSGSALLWFLEQLITFMPKAAEAWANAITSFVVSLANNAGKIFEAVKTLLGNAIQAIIDTIPKIFELLKAFLDQLWPFLQEQVPNLFAFLSTFFSQLWPFLGEQIHGLFGVLTTFFTELFTFLQTEGPMLIETIRLMIDTVLQAIIQEAPVIGQTILTLLQTLLEIINTAIPEITYTLLNLISNLLQQLAAFIPQMAESAMQIILGFLQAVANNIGAIIESAFSIAIAFMQGLTEKMPELVDTAFKMIIGFIDGLASAIEENHQALFEAVGHLIKAIVEALLDGIVMVGTAAGDLITKPGGILDSLGRFVQDLFNAGANLVQGFIDGILSMPGKIWDAACDVANRAWQAITGTLDEHSPSRVTFGGGQNFVLGFVNGIDANANMAADASASMAYGVLSAFDTTMENGVGYFTPVVAPVVDMNKLNEGIDLVSTSIGSITTALDGFPDNIKETLTIDSDKATANHQALMDLLTYMRSDVVDIWNKLSDIHSNTESMDTNTLEIARELNQGLMDKGVYLDGDTLVGSLGPRMDEYLGIRELASSRGVLTRKPSESGFGYA